MNQSKLIIGILALSFLGAVGAAGQQTQQPSDTSGQPEQQPKILNTETVTVTAPGEIRTEQTVSNTAIQEAAPGTSPVRIVSQLPSVDYTSADPYGAYEWAVRISIRGFNQNQLGFTLDEVPLGDMSYSNWNGLHISRAIQDENVGRIVLSQGTGALETASNSNLGGTVEFFSADPSDKRSIQVDQSFGSFNAYRTVGRYESGLLGGKTKFYITGVNQLTDKWKGNGPIGQNYWQLNGKVVHYFKKGVLTAYIDYSNRHETDYQDLSPLYLKKLGYNWDNFGNWTQSIQAAYATEASYALSKDDNCDGNLAGTPYSFPGAVNNLSGPAGQDPCDAAYYGGGGLRKDILGYVSYKTELAKNLTWKTTLYGHGNDGIGLWFTPYTPTVDNAGDVVSPISMRSSEYGIQRGGFVTSLTYETSRNKLEGGVWFEKDDFDLARRFYATSLDSPVQSLDSFPKNPFYTQWAFGFDTTTYQIHLQDQFKVTKAFTVSAGFKTIETNTDGTLEAGTPASNYAQGSLESGKPFLPQFGVNYKVDSHSELFADTAYNVRAYVAGGPGFANSPWGAASQEAFDALKSNLKPETSWTEEGGYRYTSNKISAQINYFHVNFSNRLLALGLSGIAGNPVALSNVSGVTTNGVDLAAAFPLGYGFSLYNGLTYSHSTYDGNVPGYTVMIAGKDAVDAPEILYKDSLAYNHKGFFANINADYMSKRFYSYDNTGSVDGRFLSDLSAGFNRESLGAFQNLKAQLSIYNLFGEQYYSSLGTNGFAVSDPAGTAQTLQVGSPRTFVGSLSARF